MPSMPSAAKARQMRPTAQVLGETENKQAQSDHEIPHAAGGRWGEDSDSSLFCSDTVYIHTGTSQPLSVTA